MSEFINSVKKKMKNMNCMQGFVALARVYKYPKYKEWMDDYFLNSILKFEELGDLNKNKNIYYMKFDSQIMGFFAYWWHSIKGLMFCERYNLIPVIDWTSSSPYYEETGINGIKNPFEYYYEPVSDITCEDALNSQNVVFFSNHATIKTSLAYTNDIPERDMVYITKKYLRIKQDVNNKIQTDINNLIKNKKTLAVHVRGVDWGNIKDHPIPLNLEEYIKIIDEIIDKFSFEQIFVASDSEKTIQCLIEKYGDKIVYYKDTKRTPTDRKTLAIFDDSIDREFNHYLLGFEVLRDMMTLVACQGLIAGASNVSLAASITKLANDEEYEYKHIFKEKINCNGTEANKAIKKMKKRKL